MRRPRTTVALAAIASAAALPLSIGCGGRGGGAATGGGGAFGLTQRVPVTTLTFPGTYPNPSLIDVVEAFPSLPSFTNPVFVTAAPGDSTHLYVVEQRGRIRVFTNTPSASSWSTFLDITGSVTSAGGEEGLLGLAFHPNYASNGLFYVNYVQTGATPRNTVIGRYQRSTGNPLVSNTAETTILTVQQPYTNHNGGMIAFGQDGMLYLGFGDGGAGGDPQNRALDPTTLLGKMLRIDVDGGSPYAIPAGNPFASSPGTQKKEIWAWGLRNPWRWSFDRTSGKQWLGDVGQGAREEVDVIVGGANYGWRAMEGTIVYNAGDFARGPFTAPVLDYDRSKGSTVVGGYVYRGSAIPALYGAYVYGDYGSGRVWAMTSDGVTVSANVEIGSANSPSSFGEDTAGEIYVCEHGSGRLLKVVPFAGGGGGPFPPTISATGVFSDLSTLAPNLGLVPYDVNAPLWSDGALKDRLMALPGNERIGWSQDGAWTFPVGTVLVKTFRLPLVAGDASSAVKVETRVLLSTSSGWEGYSYRWRDDQSDADLLLGADTRTLAIADPAAPGGTRNQTWSFPSRGNCLQCHTAATGRVLGLTTRQLNGDFDYGGTVDNQLRSWDHVDLFDVVLPSPSSLPAHPRTSDAAAPVAARARAYLDANCSMCHRPGGTSAAAIDLRSTVAVSSMGIVGATPQFGNLGLPSPQVVQSANPANSVLWLRVSALDANRMPPLASSLVDDAGLELLRQWILAGP